MRDVVAAVRACDLHGVRQARQERGAEVRRTVARRSPSAPQRRRPRGTAVVRAFLFACACRASVTWPTRVRPSIARLAPPNFIEASAERRWEVRGSPRRWRRADDRVSIARDQPAGPRAATLPARDGCTAAREPRRRPSARVPEMGAHAALGARVIGDLSPGRRMSGGWRRRIAVAQGPAVARTDGVRASADHRRSPFARGRGRRGVPARGTAAVARPVMNTAPRRRPTCVRAPRQTPDAEVVAGPMNWSQCRGV